MKVATIIVMSFLSAGGANAQTPEKIWNFDGDKAGSPPAGFLFARTGSGAQGKWVVKAESGAPSGANVLAQLDQDDTDNRFPVAVVDGLKLKDVRVTVRCKPVSGKVDSACGLVFRYVDENNYYLTRANALEDNVRLYKVEKGSRRQLESWSGSVTPGVWHTLAAEAKGEDLGVFWNGKKIIGTRDATFGQPGTVGVWTKADSVTYFDDLRCSGQ
ncbi:MAG: hypothetical protein PT977_11250 [Acidobacteriota bacterium]|nr:hypothetical protein [Acidobacteriota bacterium]